MEGFEGANLVKPGFALFQGVLVVAKEDGVGVDKLGRLAVFVLDEGLDLGLDNLLVLLADEPVVEDAQALVAP
eukprot:scaffold5973_cov42-Prasinocladus_malaysianus.AAC.3